MTSFDVSLTAVQSAQKCEQQYAYRYIERLRRKDRQVPLELGSVIHTYLDVYYSGLQKNTPPGEAHEQAQALCSAKYEPDAQRYSNVAYMAGQTDLAKSLLDVPPRAMRITSEYFKVRGRGDAERYTVLLVEQEIKTTIVRGIVNTARIDLVTQDRQTGRKHLWEHKSMREEPPRSVRLRDMQTVLYGAYLPDVEIDAVMWNYLRTKEPTIPEMLKRGGLSHRVDIDSTWSVYEAEIERNGLDVADYEDMRPRLDGREFTVFFPRYEHVIVTDPDIMLDNYVTAAIELRRKVKRWKEGAARPIRHLSRDCDWCDYDALCRAVLTSGDDLDARAMRFRVADPPPKRVKVKRDH